MIARDVFVALAVVVAKAPYIFESDSFILVLLQVFVIKCGKVSEFVGKIPYTTNIASDSLYEQSNKTIRIPDESGKVCMMDPNTRQSNLQVANVISYAEKKNA